MRLFAGEGPAMSDRWASHYREGLARPSPVSVMRSCRSVPVRVSRP